jgi:hypothetical protein
MIFMENLLADVLVVFRSTTSRIPASEMCAGCAEMNMDSLGLEIVPQNTNPSQIDIIDADWLLYWDYQLCPA